MGVTSVAPCDERGGRCTSEWPSDCSGGEAVVVRSSATARPGTTAHRNTHTHSVMSRACTCSPCCQSPHLEYVRLRRAPNRDRELLAVKVNPDDLAMLQEQLEISKGQANRYLREHGGDLKAALSSYVRSETAPRDT